MIPQGYPLWVRDEVGQLLLIIGWHDSFGYPSAPIVVAPDRAHRPFSLPEGTVLTLMEEQ